MEETAEKAGGRILNCRSKLHSLMYWECLHRCPIYKWKDVDRNLPWKAFFAFAPETQLHDADYHKVEGGLVS